MNKQSRSVTSSPTIRPIDLDDLDLEVNFLLGLSSEALYQRMMGAVKLNDVNRVRALLDYESGPSLALGAILDDGLSDLDGRSQARLIGVARYAPTGREGIAEMAIVLADDARGKGLGRTLLEALHERAQANGYREITAITFADNQPMLNLARRLGYRLSSEPGDGAIIRMSLRLMGEEDAPGVKNPELTPDDFEIGQSRMES